MLLSQPLAFELSVLVFVGAEHSISPRRHRDGSALHLYTPPRGREKSSNLNLLRSGTNGWRFSVFGDWHFGAGRRRGRGRVTLGSRNNNCGFGGGNKEKGEEFFKRPSRDRDVSSSSWGGKRSEIRVTPPPPPPSLPPSLLSSMSPT